MYAAPAPRGATSVGSKEKWVLLGNSHGITDTLKGVEAAGFAEVILYFRRMRPRQQVTEEMDRFVREVAISLEAKHRLRRGE